MSHKYAPIKLYVMTVHHYEDNKKSLKLDHIVLNNNVIEIAQKQNQNPKARAQKSRGIY